jgi:hypothetical protein
MAQSQKYGKVTTEQGFIPPDEPVFIIRAQDRLALLLLEHYRLLCVDARSTVKHLQGIGDMLVMFREWQAKNHTQTPGGMPTSPDALT